MEEKAIKADPGYTVEYIPPKPDSWEKETLFEIFSYAQKKLAENQLKGIISAKPQEVKQNGNTYYYTIPFLDDNGEISYCYDDYVAEMGDFDDFMHSYRGQCGITLERKFIPPTGVLKEKVENCLESGEYGCLRYFKESGELYTKESGYIWLLDGKDDYKDGIYGWTSDLWKKFEEAQEKLKKSLQDS